MKGHCWGCFWTSNENISASKGDTDTFESALESWDFILYDGKIFGYHRIFYGTQENAICPTSENYRFGEKSEKSS